MRCIKCSQVFKYVCTNNLELKTVPSAADIILNLFIFTKNLCLSWSENYFPLYNNCHEIFCQVKKGENWRVLNYCLTGNQLFSTHLSSLLELVYHNFLGRDKKKVATTFHGAGMVVPYDKNSEVGYREIPETTASLKKIFNKIIESQNEENEDVKNKAFDALQGTYDISYTNMDVNLRYFFCP